jgi:CheY-like chemotaxis protein
MDKNIRILIVDDEPIMRSLFTDILSDQGFPVTTVCNGKEAEEKVKDNCFDIAFVDVHMPVMDGLSTLRMLLKNCPKTAVVMTDSFPEYFLDELQIKGAVSCIHKPFHIEEIRSIVNQILEKKRNQGTYAE